MSAIETLIVADRQFVNRCTKPSKDGMSLLSAVKLRGYALGRRRECRLTGRIPTAMPSHRRRILSNGIHRLPSQVNPYPNVSPLFTLLKSS